MLLSMTGHGEAFQREGDISTSAEVRAINNRFFKLNLRVTDGFGAFEPRVDSVVREFIRRGTLYVTLRVERAAATSEYRLNRHALLAYRRQLAEVDGCAEQDIPLVALLPLPGVVDESMFGQQDTESIWPVMEKALRQAIENLNGMRAEEGRAMAHDLRENCRVIARHLDIIQQRAPDVIEGYRQRLLERLNKWLTEFDISVSSTDVVREVGLFADRSDISEEIVRLKSHLEQFDVMLSAEESNGRKLEFLTQEMFREANTIGSKANDAEVARQVIEIKAAIERLREMIQNVE